MIPVLLKALQERSRPVPAKTLGLIGEAQFPRALRGMVWRSPLLVFETRGRGQRPAALAQTKSEGKHHFFGLNFSPTFGDPFRSSFLQLRLLPLN
jgi:hypothetical protein